MLNIHIEIPGEPVAKGRARVTKHGTYTPTKTRNWENYVKIMAVDKMKGRKPTRNPVKLFVVAYLSISDSWPKWKIGSANRGLLAHTGKPDLDNLAKAITDALNGIVYKDDSQITDMSVRKRYGEIPGVDIQVEEINMIPSWHKSLAEMPAKFKELLGVK